MYHDLPSDARFWSFLGSIDEDLAETTRKQACPCGGRLHCANYPRKPRGRGPITLPETYQLRLSFCCERDGCRKRVDTAVGALPRAKGLPRRRGHPGRRHAARADATPASASFPLTSAPIAAPSRAGRSSGATLFPRPPSGRSRAPVWPRMSISRPFRGLLLDAFLRGPDDSGGWARLLRFLAPITIPGALRIELS